MVYMPLVMVVNSHTQTNRIPLQQRQRQQQQPRAAKTEQNHFYVCCLTMYLNLFYMFDINIHIFVVVGKLLLWSCVVESLTSEKKKTKLHKSFWSRCLDYGAVCCCYDA